jgi:hypothetical protein
VRDPTGKDEQHNVRAVSHEAAIDRPDLLDNPLLADELAALLERYPKRPLGLGKPSSRH